LNPELAKQDYNKELNMIKLNEQFLVNRRGKKTAVILDFRRYQFLLDLLEDLEDLYLIAERKNEPTISLEKMKEKLQKNGLLQS
jgi:hypothetical protein